MQLGTPRFLGGEIAIRPNPNIDAFCRYLIIFGRFFRELPATSREQSLRRKFFTFVPSLGILKTTARVGSISSTAEKKAVRRDGGR